MQDMAPNTIKVLDKGYLTLIECMGSDLTVVNSARVSFDKSVKYLGRKDLNLIDYLIKNKHDSPLRHCYMTFELYAPLMTARQMWKHVVGSSHLEDGSSWNESSRRYVTEEPEFYLPGDWRAVAENKKQGSGGVLEDGYKSLKYNKALEYFIETGINMYEQAIADGVAPEQARLFLPAYGMYIRWRWTASLNALLHFCDLRLDNHAQWEIQQYAQGVYSLVKENFPTVATSWEKFRRES